MFNANYEMFKSSVMGKKIAVLGLGVSNVPAIEFLKNLGAFVTGCDRNKADKFDAPVFERIKNNCHKLYLGDDYLDHLDEFDMILKSPGIKVSTPQIQKAIADGKTVTSEIDIFMSMCPCKMIGVTGSDGKTTTTTLIYEMLKADGYRVHIGGNIGKPLLSQLDNIHEDDIVVLELSSFQLQTLTVSPEIAVITNITPNHLDYHKDMEEYIEAKSNIFKFHDKNCRIVLNNDNIHTKNISQKYDYDYDMFSSAEETDGAYIKDGKIFYKHKPILDVARIRIKGKHNAENYMAAICAVRPFVSEEAIDFVAKNFGGVEHRMEYVRRLDDVVFYNDSIGSSPTRTIAGLNAQPPGKIVLIAGGYDKNLAFDELARKITERVDVLVLMGATASKIENEVKHVAGNKRIVHIVKVKDMKNAVKSAFALAKGLKNQDGDEISVILSPACASFDMYKNFEERGKAFKNEVNSLK